jgi:hypothetical protein
MSSTFPDPLSFVFRFGRSLACQSVWGDWRRFPAERGDFSGIQYAVDSRLMLKQFRQFAGLERRRQRPGFGRPAVFAAATVVSAFLFAGGREHSAEEA